MRSFLLFLCTITTAFAAPKIPSTLAIGSKGPDFSLPGVDGQTYSLESFAEAKAIALIFTCNHCPDAVAARGRIQQLATDYKPKGVEVVAISGNDPKALQLWELGWSVYGDSFPEMKTLSAEIKMTYPYLYDGDTQKATLAYGAQSTPHVFILDEQRILRYTGQLDNGRRGTPTTYATRIALDEILAGKEVTTPKTRVFGCSTKWSWKRSLAEEKSKEWASLPVSLVELDVKTAKQLSENKTDKLRLINIWATDCGPCVAEFPDLIDTVRRYQNRNLELITISMDSPDKEKDVLTFLKKQHVAISPKIIDSVLAEGRSTNNYHFTGKDADAFASAIDPKWEGPQPHSVLIAPGGQILWRHTGQLDKIDLRRAIVKATNK